jgi:diguanylate cyclase (GGDEF)-like protein
MSAVPARQLPGALEANAPYTLLLVDDQAINIQSLYQVFAGTHKVLAATHGAQALQVAQTQQPDLILLDVMMPGMDGYEVCRQLKEKPETRDIPVIFLTSQSDTGAETEGFALGAVDFIAKPFSPEVVRARVQAHLTLKRQTDLLRRWVFIDGLTGVYNRRHFDERLQAEWGRALRLRSPLSLLMIDVDHFKRFNDTHGHQCGDDALRLVAQTLQTHLRRSSDVLFRYGGEEFVCLLPDTDEAGALRVADTLRQAIASLPPVSLGVAHGITASLGVGALRHGQMQQPQQLIAEADANLYRAKHAGRNRVCAGPDDMALT